MARKTDRTKPPQEAKQEASSDATTGEQLDLIDVAPENSKEIIALARAYKSAQGRRIDALEEEVAAKVKLLALIKGANLQRLDDGKIRLHLDGYTITVTPRDELVKVKEDSEEGEGA